MLATAFLAHYNAPKMFNDLGARFLACVARELSVSWTSHMTAPN